MSTPDDIARDELERIEQLGNELLEPEFLDPEQRDPEAPTADAVEQATPADRAQSGFDVRRGLEVGEYDALEQARVVELDDEYRQ